MVWSSFRPLDLNRPPPNHNRASLLPQNLQTLVCCFLDCFSSNRVCTKSKTVATPPWEWFKMPPIQRIKRTLLPWHPRNEWRHLHCLLPRLASSLPSRLNLLPLPLLLRQNSPPPLPSLPTLWSRRRLLISAHFSRLHGLCHRPKRCHELGAAFASSWRQKMDQVYVDVSHLSLQNHYLRHLL